MRATFDRRVVNKMQLRHNAQLHRMCELAAQITACMLQTLLHCSAFAVQGGVEDLGVGIVPGHLNSREGDHAYARIFHVEAQQLSHLALNLFGYTVCPYIAFRHLKGVPLRLFQMLQADRQLRGHYNYATTSHTRNSNALP